MEAQQPVLLSRAWSRGNLSGSLAHTAVFIPVAVCSLEGVNGLICLGPYLSEVPVTPFWCPLVQLLLLGTHWCSALLSWAKAGGHVRSCVSPTRCWSCLSSAFFSRDCCGLAPAPRHPWLCSPLENLCQPSVCLLSCSRNRMAVLCLLR